MPNVFSGTRSIAHADLISRAMRAATALRASGIGEGDSIALLLRNDFAFFEATLAARAIGAYSVPINWHFKTDETNFIVADSGAKALVAHADLLRACCPKAPPDVNVYTVETPPEIAAAYGTPPASANDAYDSWEQLTENAVAATPVDVIPLPMIYTSGTTGRPKGVQRVLSPGAAPPSPAPFGFDDPQHIVTLMNGPMYHSAPNFYGMGAFNRGADIVLQPRFDPEELLALIEQRRVTHMHIVPTMFVRLLRLSAEIRARYDLSSLRHVVHGAGPCSPEVKRAMIQWWGPVINEYYGSTETGIATWHTSAEALAKPGTVGRALPGVDIAIVRENGEEAARNEIGEIFIRPAGADFTYRGQDDQRKAVGRGEHATVGDIGFVDEDGYLFLCDRKRDMIISGGVNIYPAEIEGILITMPGVRDCAVFGIRDEEFGERVCACIVAESSTAVTPQTVRSWLSDRIARYKNPSVIHVVPELPREDTGKVFKRLLKERFSDEASKTG